MYKPWFYEPWLKVNLDGGKSLLVPSLSRNAHFHSYTFPLLSLSPLYLCLAPSFLIVGNRVNQQGTVPAMLLHFSLCPHVLNKGAWKKRIYRSWPHLFSYKLFDIIYFDLMMFYNKEHKSFDSKLDHNDVHSIEKEKH